MALGVLAASLVLANAGLVGPAVGAMELVYLVHVLLAGQPTLLAVGFVALAGLLAGELGQWSIDSRFGGEVETAVHVARLRAIAGLVALSAAVVAIVSLAAIAPIVQGTWTIVLAVAASIAVVALVSRAARRSSPRLG